MKNLYLVMLALVILVSIPVIPAVSAHGVSTGLQSRFARLENTALSDKTIDTGQNVTITGKIANLIEKTLDAKLSFYSEPGQHGRWSVLSINPRGHFTMSGNSVMPYSITAKALLPGKYYLSPELYLSGIGSGKANYGTDTKPNIQVNGDFSCTNDLVGVIKTENDLPYCVKPQSMQKLIERGWAVQIQ